MMLPANALAAVLALAALWPGHDDGRVVVAQAQAGDWRYSVRRDGFSDRVVCELRARGAAYRGGLVLLTLRPGENAADALYRVDDAPPTPVRSHDMEIVQLGAPLYDDVLAPPGATLVRLPARVLMTARVLAIQTQLYRRPFRFKLNGLEKALSETAKLGCTPGNFS